MRKNWTLPELKMLADAYASHAPLSELIHLFGGRSIDTVRAKARKEGLVHQSLPARIRELMTPQAGSAPIARTAAEVAVLLGVDKKPVRDVLNAMIKSEAAHIVDYRGSYHEIVYIDGPGENVPKPCSSTPDACRKRFIARQAASVEPSDTELDEIYRTDGKWWPRADPVIVSSINAMVHAGRRAQ